MLSFNALQAEYRFIFLCVSFIAVCSSVCLAVPVFKSGKALHKIFVPISALLSFAVLVLYAADLMVHQFNAGKSALSLWFCQTPLVFSLCILFAVLIYSAFLWRKARRIRKSTLSSASIKEGLDAITAGLCFARSNGIIVLSNSCMNQLCYAITGGHLQNANDFWRFIVEGESAYEAVRLSIGSCSFRLADGTIWTFTRKETGKYVQISATNTTQMHIVAEEIKKRNIKLAAMNFRLKKYGENVNALTRSQERLETKVRIHNELGQALLATRQHLLGTTPVGSNPSPHDVWKRNIAMLRKRIEAPVAENPLNTLKRVADSTGVTVVINGEMPDCEYAEQIILQGATEALTNAVIHAKAKTLYISLKEQDGYYTASYTNDGLVPEKRITEGGGLSSLRKKVKRAGGNMLITCKPVLTVEISIPKNRGIVI